MRRVRNNKGSVITDIMICLGLFVLALIIPFLFITSKPITKHEDSVEETEELTIKRIGATPGDNYPIYC
jgi:flagellar basal body-associated protein FliL